MLNTCNNAETITIRELSCNTKGLRLKLGTLLQAKRPYGKCVFDKFKFENSQQYSYFNPRHNESNDNNSK